MGDERERETDCDTLTTSSSCRKVQIVSRSFTVSRHEATECHFPCSVVCCSLHGVETGEAPGRFQVGDLMTTMRP